MPAGLGRRRPLLALLVRQLRLLWPPVNHACQASAIPSGSSSPRTCWPVVQLQPAATGLEVPVAGTCAPGGRYATLSPGRMSAETGRPTPPRRRNRRLAAAFPCPQHRRRPPLGRRTHGRAGLSRAEPRLAVARPVSAALVPLQPATVVAGRLRELPQRLARPPPRAGPRRTRNPCTLVGRVPGRLHRRLRDATSARRARSCGGGVDPQPLRRRRGALGRPVPHPRRPLCVSAFSEPPWRRADPRSNPSLPQIQPPTTASGPLRRRPFGLRSSRS